jgi:hypothetical protein
MSPHFGDYQFLVLETNTSRSVYLMFESDQTLHSFVELVRGYMNKTFDIVPTANLSLKATEASPMRILSNSLIRKTESMSSRKTESTQTMDESDSFQNLESTRVLSGDLLAAVGADKDDPSAEFMHRSTKWNCKHRRILNCEILFPQKPMGAESPLALAETTLRLVLRLRGPDSDRDSDNSDARQRAFLHSAAALKTVSIQALSNEARMV